MKQNMKRIIDLSLLGALTLFAFVRCSDWTEAEALEYDHPLTESVHGEAYYRNLRAYKADKDHVKAFAWYSDWTSTGTDIYGRLVGLPDSMDFVSMWGNNFNLSESKQRDLREVQTKKGTKVLMCWIVDNIGVQTTPADVVQNGTQREFWGWFGEGYDDAGEPIAEEVIEAAVRKYARSIIDSMNKYGFDGFDLDLEPHYGSSGNIASHPQRLHYLLDELSKEMGPASGTDRLLCVDGEPEWLLPETGLLLDHFLLQAYEDSSTQRTDSRLASLFNTFESVMSREEIVRKTILTANFESFGGTGGRMYTLRNSSTRVNQVKAYAMYSYPGVDAKIGGIGAFRVKFDENYKYLREAIQVANPVIK